MRRFPGDLICRSAVDDASKPAVDGVMRALRFCVIESSMLLLDIRRKSRKAVSLKQNLGVRDGLVEGCDISDPDNFCGLDPGAGRLQKNPATLQIWGRMFVKQLRELLLIFGLYQRQLNDVVQRHRVYSTKYLPQLVRPT